MLVCCLTQFPNNLTGWLAAHLNPSPADSQFHVRLIVMLTEAHTKSHRGHQDLFVHVAHHCNRRRASTKEGNTLEDSSDSTLKPQMNIPAISAPNTFDFT